MYKITLIKGRLGALVIGLLLCAGAAATESVDDGPREHVSVTAATPAVEALPLTELPAAPGGSDSLAVIVSGDGGWAGLVKTVAAALVAEGIPVAGLNSLRYFWQERLPDESALALEAILRHYLTTWNKQRVLLIGYSRGADMLPFMTSRLPADLRERIDVIALLGPATMTSFSVHIPAWLFPNANDTPTLPELEKLRGFRMLCVYGKDETDSACPALPDGIAQLERRPGGHHFDRDYQFIASRILDAAAH